MKRLIEGLRKKFACSCQEPTWSCPVDPMSLEAAEALERLETFRVEFFWWFTHCEVEGSSPPSGELFQKVIAAHDRAVELCAE